MHLQVLPLPEYADFGRRRADLAPTKEDAVDGGDASALARARRFDVNKFKIHKVGHMTMMRLKEIIKLDSLV